MGNSPDPRISVVIPNWNGEALLPPCLNTLRAQTFRDFETIVVDNASTDGSVPLLQRDYPEVRVVKNPVNLGFTGGVNVGILAARGQVIVLLNTDVEVESEWLAAIDAALAEHPEVGMIACRIMLHDRRDSFHSAGDVMGRDGIPRNRGVWQVDGGQYAQPEEVFGPCGGAAAYRREVLEDVGLFDERFFMYLEDVDFAWRAQALGYRCLYEPRSVVYHRLSATGGGATASYYSGRNTIAVLVKNLPDELWHKHWRAIVMAQLRISVSAFGAWRGKAARARLRGQLAALPMALRLWPSRRSIQARRRVPVEQLEAMLV